MPQPAPNGEGRLASSVTTTGVRPETCAKTGGSPGVVGAAAADLGPVGDDDLALAAHGVGEIANGDARDVAALLVVGVAAVDLEESGLLPRDGAGGRLGAVAPVDGDGVVLLP